MDPLFPSFPTKKGAMEPKEDTAAYTTVMADQGPAEVHALNAFALAHTVDPSGGAKESSLSESSSQAENSTHLHEWCSGQGNQHLTEHSVTPVFHKDTLQRQKGEVPAETSCLEARCTTCSAM